MNSQALAGQSNSVRPETKPLVSVIVRAFNEERHIGRLLEGIFRQEVNFEFEVILVDSGSTDRTVQIAQVFGARIVQISPSQFTFGFSLNCGIKEARGEICVIVSAHCYPGDEQWLKCMVGPFSDPKIGLVYGKQRGDESTRWSEHMVFKSIFPDQSEDTSSLPFANNANSAIRRSYWNQLKFDESLTGFEDLDWAKRLHKSGGKIAYQADSFVYHVHNETARQIFRRYFREALAYREIYGQHKFTMLSFVSFFILNVKRDYVEALKSGHLLRSLIDVPVFRFMQFLGTYRAYQHVGRSAYQIQRKLFYPENLHRIEGDTQRAAAENYTAPAFVPELEVFDISKPISSSLPVWPGSQPFRLNFNKSYEKDGVTDSTFIMNSHCGTHLDAPSHMSPSKISIDQLDCAKCLGPALVVEYYNSGQIEAEFFERLGVSPSCQRILIKTNNSFAGDDKFDTEFVAITSAAARWLVERKINLVGIDGPSIQLYRDSDNQTHETLLGAGVVILENLDLSRVNTGEYTLIALPLKIVGSEASPTRAVLIKGSLTGL